MDFSAVRASSRKEDIHAGGDENLIAADAASDLRVNRRIMTENWFNQFGTEKEIGGEYTGRTNVVQ